MDNMPPFQDPTASNQAQKISPDNTFLKLSTLKIIAITRNTWVNNKHKKLPKYFHFIQLQYIKIKISYLLKIIKRHSPSHHINIIGYKKVSTLPQPKNLPTKTLESKRHNGRKMNLILITNDNESHPVEPGTEVGQTPQHAPKFDRVDDVLNQEESAQFPNASVHVCHGDVGHLVHLFRWQGEVQLKNVPGSIQKL